MRSEKSYKAENRNAHVMDKMLTSEHLRLSAGHNDVAGASLQVGVAGGQGVGAGVGRHHHPAVGLGLGVTHVTAQISRYTGTCPDKVLDSGPSFFNVDIAACDEYTISMLLVKRAF